MGKGCLSRIFDRIRWNLFTSAKTKGKVEAANNRKKDMLALIPALQPLTHCANPNSTKYIVSLTSYGKRLIDTAPYTIVSLLNQNVKPDKLILWVAHNDKENVTDILRELTSKGLEIRFCEDIRSYKKLIPALREFPDDYIITADDDVYYPQDWFEQLIVEHKKNYGKIICLRATGITVDKNHRPLPYKKWFGAIVSNSYFAVDCAGEGRMESIFPTGMAGILYPPKCFHEDILNIELFTKLAPNGDDIWFWAMAVINQKFFGKSSPYVIVPNNCWQQNRIQDVETKHMRREKPLWHYNLKKKGNDSQIEAVINSYPQIIEYLKRIKPV